MNKLNAFVGRLVSNLVDRAVATKSSSDEAGERIKRWWRKQHAAHVFLALLISVGALITFVVTVNGILAYYWEVGDRARERELREIDIAKGAWVRIDATRGVRGDRGQGAAIQALLSATRVAGAKRIRNPLEFANLNGVDASEVDF